MAEARYLLKPGDVAYGNVCPECASPKHRQSKRCASCYYDTRRLGAFPPPPRLTGPANGSWKPSGHTGHRATGRGKGRPQSQAHPWRGKNKLLFALRVRAEVAR